MWGNDEQYGAREPWKQWMAGMEILCSTLTDSERSSDKQRNDDFSPGLS